MDFLYICNLASDYISKVNLSELKEYKIPLCNKSGKVGPHGICSYENNLIVANSFSNSISKIDVAEGREVENYYIGMHCNAIDIYNNEAYITCGESNTISIFDLKQNKLVEDIPSGGLPHSVNINKENGLMAVANMESDSITLIDLNSKEFNKEFRVGPYPMKVIISKDGKVLYICESNLGSDKNGSIAIFSLETFNICNRIVVGKGPMDMFIEDNLCYVANFNEGTLSVVYLDDNEEVKKYSLGGMPRGIVKKGRYLYVGDNYSNTLIKLDMYKEDKKVISIGGEPTGMTLI